MENIEQFKELLKSVINTDTLHEEYEDNNIKFIVDSKKIDDATLQLTIHLEEGNKDKEEFEKWLDKMDDEIFEEIWSSLGNKHGLQELNSAYAGENYKSVINLFKEEAENIISKKIEKLNHILSMV